MNGGVSVVNMAMNLIAAILLFGLFVWAVGTTYFWVRGGGRLRWEPRKWWRWINKQHLAFWFWYEAMMRRYNHRPRHANVPLFIALARKGL
jgi:hypothetical protein